MKTPKTPMLRDLLRAQSKASWLARNPQYSVSDLLDLIRHRAYSRRSFLGDMGKLALGAAVLPPFLGSCTSRTSGEITGSKKGAHAPKIAVIGGGIAGLTCIHTLAKAGIEANLYEASSRIGGRMYTRRNVFGPGINTEFGGEFLDTSNQDMLGLVREFGLELLDAHEEFPSATITKDTYFFNGRHITEAEVIEAFMPVAGKMEADVASCGEDYDTPECVRLDNTSLEEYIEQLQCDSWLKDLLLYAYLAEYGLEGGEQSSLNLVDFIGKDTSEGFKIFGESDERYKIIGGNQRLPEVMADRYRSRIETGYHLEAIRQIGDGYRLSFQNGKEVNADVVVVTIPFTILRDIEIRVDGMPEEKRLCIDSLGYGLNNKLILGTNSRPWREMGYAGYVYNDKIYTGWDSAHMQGGNTGPAGYTVYLSGDQAVDAARRTQAIDRVHDDVAKAYLKDLDRIFPGSERAYAGVHYAALWTNNPYVRASYSCYRPGQWTTISGLEGEPVGNLYFAGEHCSEMFQGFMNGGAETGRMAAEAILAKVEPKPGRR